MPIFPEGPDFYDDGSDTEAEANVIRLLETHPQPNLMDIANIFAQTFIPEPVYSPDIQAEKVVKVVDEVAKQRRADKRELKRVIMELRHKKREVIKATQEQIKRENYNKWNEILSAFNQFKLEQNEKLAALERVWEQHIHEKEQALIKGFHDV